MPLTPEGWTLLKTWEGCRLNAYPDPASGGAPWSIGYGHTGAEVVPGLTITQEQAETWLKQDVAEAAAAVDRLLNGVTLSPRQRDALISFCFNVGAGAMEGSTLRRRCLAGESPAVVITQEFPRWCKGPNGPVEGLKRRRAAEVQHAQRLEETAARSTAAQANPASASGLIQLPVPYLSQNDSATSQGSRMCFSSSCAMAAAFLKPDAIQGPGQPDDQYLALVQRHGDTTDASAQVKALQTLGLQARFRTDGSIEHLIEQLERGLPCPVGWLHRGPVSTPTGGGHWSLVIGWDPAKRQVLMHDPNGEADLVNGGYVNTSIGSGAAQRYSERNWGRRWMVEGAGTGWWIQINTGT
ncbi:glycoside hydrolase family protein [Vulcanococcus sp. Clear-D1]|uniref:glycoside hydrolase family protein n=1 Tax=Vulcanococcus sp. Clear-D1 TaxID=2766970 RepID=UPI0019C55C00|nr:glycoside hydrolase family protein [Vulcanococcus sp. Clear-D1]MBD1195364.1 glycoside hydrolase family protein [Vulcanococcus sp. Clear-D1]